MLISVSRSSPRLQEDSVLKNRNDFLSNLTLATLLNILLIQIVISWFLLQNAWIRHFFFNIHFFFLSPKSRQIAALHIIIFCPCYWIRHLIRPHDWHTEKKKCKNLFFVEKRQYNWLWNEEWIIFISTNNICPKMVTW